MPGIVFLEGFEWEEKRKHSNTSKVEIFWYGFSTNLVKSSPAEVMNSKYLGLLTEGIGGLGVLKQRAIRCS